LSAVSSGWRRNEPLRGISVMLAAVLIAAWPSAASAQALSQRGFLDAKGVAYPQTTPQDDTRLVGEALLRYEVSARPASWLRFGGALDARGDTHDQTAWDGLDWSDRGLKRPGFGVRRLDAAVNRGPVALQVGKQFIRWGKTDILNPTDRFAPRDYLAVMDSDFLGVTAGRLTLGVHSDSLDLVWARFTPSRTPLLDQRWSGLPAALEAVQLIDRGAVYPERSQVGARWNHVGSGYEFSLAAFNGNNNLPLIETVVPIPAARDPATSVTPLTAAAAPGQVYVPIVRIYPNMWMAGGDAAVPLPGFTIKGEAAYFGTDDPRADEYWLYVIQLERQSGEWSFTGGYAGEIVTTARVQAAFAPDRGMTKAFLGRAGYTLDTNRSLAFEGAVRQNGNGSWLQFEYSQASGQHLRCTARATWIRGAPTDFFGRYAKNSNIGATIRYSF
jgi:hypothetical protein